MKCECLKAMNKMLAEYNIRIATGLLIKEQDQVESLEARVVIATEKVDQKLRKRPPNVVASYCPFCGTKAGD